MKRAADPQRNVAKLQWGLKPSDQNQNRAFQSRPPLGSAHGVRGQSAGKGGERRKMFSARALISENRRVLT